MASYEPDILEQFADRLYKEAADIISQNVFGGVFVGIFLGVIIGFAVGFAESLQKQTPGTENGVPIGIAAAVLLAVVGGVSGYYHGKEKAFELRLKAQQALCQLQIEKNTRKA